MLNTFGPHLDEILIKFGQNMEKFMKSMILYFKLSKF